MTLPSPDTPFLHVIPRPGVGTAGTQETQPASARVNSLGQRVAEFGERVRVFTKQCEELKQQLAHAADSLQGPAEMMPARELSRRLSRSQHAFDQLWRVGLNVAHEMGVTGVEDAQESNSLTQLEGLVKQVETAWLLRLKRVGQTQLALDVLERVLRVAHNAETPLPALQECQAQAATLQSSIVHALDAEGMPEVQALADGQHPYCLLLLLLEHGDQLDQAEWDQVFQKLEGAFPWDLTRAVIRRRLHVAAPPNTTPAPKNELPEAQDEPAALPVAPRTRPLAGAIEALALLLAALAPWAFFGIHPVFESCLYTGIFVLLSLWGARMAREGRVIWCWCPAVLTLALLFAFGLLQLTPLPFLRFLSPATTRMYEQFLPAVQETLPFGLGRLFPVLPAGFTISLFPGVSWRELVRLLAIVCLFAAVRNNLPVSALRRLSIVALFNGAALALLGTAQYFSSPHDTIYWTFRAPGDTFFITAGRNHTPFYLNICIGLSMGLLLWVRARTVRQPRKDRVTSELARTQRFLKRTGEGNLTDTLLVLKDVEQLWIIAGLVLMIVAVIVCQSRGAFVALTGAAALACILHVLVARSLSFRLGTIVIVLTCAAVLLSWLGFEWTNSRVMTMLWKSNPLNENRVELWRTLLQPIREFPVFGTGFGTLGFVEYPVRDTAGEEHIFNGHAYNEFLHALVEGGVVRLVLTVLFVGFVFRAGYRAYRRHAGTPMGGLVLGALFALATVLIHCSLDPGMRLPANAFLGTLLCAELCIVGSDRPEQVRGTAAAAQGARTELRPILLLAAAAAVTLPGLLLFREGVRFVKTQRALEAARAAMDSNAPIRRELQIAHLEEAAALSPENAWVQLELAEANLAMFREQSAGLQQGEDVFRAVEIVAGLAGRPILAAAPATAASVATRDSLVRNQVSMLTRHYLGTALQRYLLARDLCPLLAPVQVRLAVYSNLLQNREPRERYLERAKRLIPSDPEFWYLCGVQEIADGQPELAWQSWKRSLRLADTYFSSILARCRTELSPGQLLDQVLPDHPALIFDAAQQLFAQPDADPEGRRFLQKVLAVISQKPAGFRTGVDWYLQARSQAALGEWDQAFTSYQHALQRDAENLDWRFEYASLLYDRGRTPEARRELVSILQAQPNHARARALYHLGRAQESSGDAP